MYEFEFSLLSAVVDSGMNIRISQYFKRIFFWIFPSNCFQVFEFVDRVLFYCDLVNALINITNYFKVKKIRRIHLQNEQGSQNSIFQEQSFVAICFIQALNFHYLIIRTVCFCVHFYLRSVVFVFCILFSYVLKSMQDCLAFILITHVARENHLFQLFQKKKKQIERSLRKYKYKLRQNMWCCWVFCCSCSSFDE